LLAVGIALARVVDGPDQQSAELIDGGFRDHVFKKRMARPVGKRLCEVI
jgi:hypothetical protein